MKVSGGHAKTCLNRDMTSARFVLKMLLLAETIILTILTGIFYFSCWSNCEEIATDLPLSI